jgi:hypothetical protein
VKTAHTFTLVVLGIFMLSSGLCAQHLRIYACAIGNDSVGASMGGSSNGSGLYESDDTGKTWKHLGWDNIKCYSMDMVQSSNGRILYEATGLGILRSVDGGEHWKQITDWRISEALDVAVNQKNPNEIYIATAHGPWGSEDGGKKWEALLDGLRVPYTCRIVIDSVLPNHVLVAAEEGIFSLSGNIWKQITCGRRNIHNVIEKNATDIRCIVQLSRNRWLAASGNSRELLSWDTAKSFGTPSYGQDSLWAICGISLNRYREVMSMGGPSGTSRVERNYDMLAQPTDDKMKNVSAIIEIIIPYKGKESPFLGVLNESMCGTLGDGVYFDGMHTLLNRQIWTLKSFLVTP